MNVVGYLITLANLQSFEDSGGPLKDLSIRMSEVQTLANELRNHPEFTIEGFRQTGYFQVGNVGKYLSQNLRNYLFHGNVNPKDEGVILTLDYSNRTPAPHGSSTNQEDGTLSYYVHKTGDLSKEERQNIYRYLDTVKRVHRNKRTVSDMVN
ncbi:uncharacterized protein LOC125242768 [Leguminivora glycinivorella]|uniref:uncharacterized protein LOC125242768 n=1 Tax=Leguminivora glycinivorella TaxID=1035111 RepID=UPI00200EFDC3|nr:uncharacterized protein LOC125242768 [Leguminivora glycinivorella]